MVVPPKRFHKTRVYFKPPMPTPTSKVLERFLRYVQVDTTAVPDAGSYPSSQGQLVLGRMLADELRAIGLVDVEQDEHGLVWATIPGTTPGVETIALCAHMDTSPETSGTNVRPQVWPNYDGRDLVLPGDPTKILSPRENPELSNYVGRTLVTSDGTTLLGADDKAGIAAIMETAARLVTEPSLPHGPIRICFTCDEEIGHGVDHVAPEKLGAVCCYTLDGHGQDEIDVETFAADHALVMFTGVNIHPSIAKGRMVNALRAAGKFLDRLPRDTLAPETTDGRDGFLHPYSIEGGVASAKLHVLLRDFDAKALEEYASLLRKTAAEVEKEFPGLAIDVTVMPQYRNLADGLAHEPRAVAYAEEAIKNLGRAPKKTIVRGGTDGSRLTEIGVPTPNLSTAEHDPHSPLEWCCVEELEAAVDMLIELAAVWARHRSPVTP
jgi:tripeptide aminopeptidase